MNKQFLLRPDGDIGSACTTGLTGWLQTVLIVVTTLTIHLPLVSLFPIAFPAYFAAHFLCPVGDGSQL